MLELFEVCAKQISAGGLEEYRMQSTTEQIVNLPHFLLRYHLAWTQHSMNPKPSTVVYTQRNPQNILVLAQRKRRKIKSQRE